MKTMYSVLHILLLSIACISVAARQPRTLNILLTNDDGYHTEEIQTLKQTLRDAGHNVFLVAPSSNQSGCGTSVQLSSRNVQLIAIDVDEYALASAEAGYTSGPHAGKPWPATPGQCVLVGEELMHQAGYTPDIVISGPNHGENVSVRCLHSGTVGAAQVARSICMGRKSLPSIAVNINLGADTARIQEAAQFVTDFVTLLDIHRGENDQLLPENILLNINIPGINIDLNGQMPIKGVRLTKSAQAVYDMFLKSNTVFRAFDTGKNVFRIDLHPIEAYEDIPDSDNTAVLEGYITIVPFACDFTAHAHMEELDAKLQQLFALNE